MNPSTEDGPKGSSPWWMSPFWLPMVTEENAKLGFPLNLSMEDGASGVPPHPGWTSPYCQEKMRIFEEDAMICQGWKPRDLEELMPDLPRDEQLWLQHGFRDRECVRKRRRKKKLPPLPPPSPSSRISQQKDDEDGMISLVLDALRHYNARHPGGEFDPVKPLARSNVLFRGHEWFHINFWACSRANSKIIKRFFAEIHHKSLFKFLLDNGKGVPPLTPINEDPQSFLKGFPSIVETCTIIEGPLSQYKRSCGFCHAEDEIFHPKGCRKFVCGNDKDRTYQRLERPGYCGFGNVVL